jgi:hypothetical protein
VNYLALYKYVRDISQNLGFTSKFFHGRKEFLNLTDPNKPLYVYSLPFTASGGFNTSQQLDQTWQINLIFYMRDQADSAIDQNDQDTIQDEIATLTVTDQAADKFIHLFNDNDINTDLEAASELITVISFSKSNAIKDTAQLLTGTVLTLNVRVDDRFDYCCV